MNIWEDNNDNIRIYGNNNIDDVDNSNGNDNNYNNRKNIIIFVGLFLDWV